MDNPKVRTRVRASSRPRSGWPRIRTALKSGVSGLRWKRVLLVALGLYVLVSLVGWYVSTVTYGDVGMSDDKNAVRYALGGKHGGAETDRIWTYKGEADAVIRVEFTPDGLLDQISCASPSAEPDSCPELYGIGIGDAEDAIGGSLGSPSRIGISGDRKYISYDSLGATFVLQQFAVTGLIRDPDRGSFLGKAWKFVRHLVYLPGAIG